MGGKTKVTLRVALFLLAGLYTAPALGWNALGHKVVAEIAWREIAPERRQEIVDTLRRHPRFDADFAGKMPDDVLAADKSIQDRWVFQAAAYWPDVARGTEHDRPKWHYVNLPLFTDAADRTALAERLTTNVSAGFPSPLPKPDYNVLQAIQYCQSVLSGPAGLEAKAFAYCWLFHLVGDVHQPLHAVSLYSAKRFPHGDRGGNSVPLRRGRNLHALWDELLGSGDRLRDVDREVTELSRRYGGLWRTTSRACEPLVWAEESKALAESFVYDAAILGAVRQGDDAELAPIELPTAYMQTAGGHARQRIVVAGIRLGALLNDGSATGRKGKADQPSAVPGVSRFSESAPKPAAATAYWLNTSSGVRHNSSCKWFEKTKRGRYCTADDGKPCGECGG